MWTQLLNECLDRTGRRVMLVSILLGILAGLGVSRIVQVTGEFWSNAGLMLLIGGSIAFGLDLFFISPVRLWRDTKAELSVANGELRALRAAPPAGMRIGHVDTQINIQVSDGALLRVSASSNTIIVGQDQEGILVPRGTLFRSDTYGTVGFSGALAAIHMQGSGDISFVPPELLSQGTEEPPS